MLDMLLYIYTQYILSVFYCQWFFCVCDSMSCRVKQWFLLWLHSASRRQQSLTCVFWAAEEERAGLYPEAGTGLELSNPSTCRAGSVHADCDVWSSKQRRTGTHWTVCLFSGDTMKTLFLLLTISLCFCSVSGEWSLVTFALLAPSDSLSEKCWFNHPR